MFIRGPENPLVFFYRNIFRPLSRSGFSRIDVINRSLLNPQLSIISVAPRPSPGYALPMAYVPGRAQRCK